MLTSFPPLLSEVRGKIGEVWNGWGGGTVLALLDLKTFPFLLCQSALTIFVHLTMLSLFLLLLWFLFALFFKTFYLVG